MIFNFKENKRMRIYKTKKTYFNGKDFLSLGVTLRALRLKQVSLLLALLLSLPFWACANVKGVFQQGSPPPPELPSLLAAGNAYTCTVLRGGMKCWGDGRNGRLGDGLDTVHQQKVPVNVKGLEPGKNKGVTAVSAGDEHTCAVVQGGVKCWGAGGSGRLGYGSESGKSVPVDVKGLEPGTDKGLTAVSAGNTHTCAVVRGGVKCWGAGDSGRLGYGFEVNKKVPVDVKGLEPGTDKGVSAVSAGRAHTCAVVRGGVKCWGKGDFGRLGDGSATNKSVPLDVKGLEPGTGKGVTAVSAGNTHTCAVVRGGVKCWGAGDSGRLGYGFEVNKKVPVDVKGLEPGKYKGVTAVSAGAEHTCAVLRGGLKCWGNGQYGSLGDGLEREHNQLSPLVDVKLLEPGTGKGVSAVSAGNSHTCAMVKRGIKCWGSGRNGALGLADVITSFQNVPIPRDVQGLDK